MNSDDQLRALLEDAVADVRPRSGLDSIRSRTTSSAPARKASSKASSASAESTTAGTTPV